MATDYLKIFIRSKINKLNVQFNNKKKFLNNILKNNINSILRSRYRNKQALINALIYRYKRDINVLKQNYDTSLQKIQSFVPEFNINKNTIKEKKALLIGINYVNTSYELSGCVDDTTRMKELLTTYGFNNIKIITDLTDIKPTKQNILSEFKNLLVNSKSGDLLFFYYSGHGSYTYDQNKDEPDGKDEMIISSDFQGVVDDELKRLIQKHLLKDVTIIGLFDSCHSGSMFDLKFNYLDSNNSNKFTEHTRISECNGNVIMISGCMDKQTSSEAFIENKVQGALTWSFINVLNNNPELSWREMLTEMRTQLKTNGFSQIPQLSTDSFYDINSKIFI